MNRNQKIALGCGGAGCLGLIVIAIAGAAVYLLVYRQPARRAVREYNFNVNLNDNSSNSNSNASTPDVDANSNTANSNANENANSNSNSNSGSATSADSMSDDDKHKLFQAASMTGDAELVRRVLVKLGLTNEDYTPGEKYSAFMGEHISWGARNYQFIQSINTPDKARAYVNAHFPE
jgi:D-arabinose 1-dehydrogenase-like Zn-dependent alcohol dehydrogenase